MDHAEYCAQFLLPGDAVLDVGSGRGKFLCAMAELGYRAYGAETSPEYVRQAIAAAQERGLTVVIKLGAAEQIPFSDHSFSFVNCAEVSEHIDNPSQMCTEIYRVLKSGGRCYISFHNRFGWYDYHYHLFGINWLPRFLTEPILRFLGKQKIDGKGIGRQKLTTMHYFTYRSALALVQAQGFNVIDIRIKKIRDRYPQLVSMFLLPYYIFLRLFYFNTFHLLLEKR